MFLECMLVNVHYAHKVALCVCVEACFVRLQTCTACTTWVQACMAATGDTPGPAAGQSYAHVNCKQVVMKCSETKRCHTFRPNRVLAPNACAQACSQHAHLRCRTRTSAHAHTHLPPIVQQPQLNPLCRQPQLEVGQGGPFALNDGLVGLGAAGTGREQARAPRDVCVCAWRQG